ncbi:MAG: 16S rRNA (adenine(1518)-N(6)/adenine(1519)-N(6))-dimethyltransferase RsmA [Acidimicrobiales bacterium]
MMLGAGAVRDLLERYGIEPSRALGQNFVTDPNTIQRIVSSASVEPGDRIVEIGPGVGSLTHGLVDAGADVVAVELDEHLVPALVESMGDAVGHGVDIVQADAMKLDWAAFFAQRDRGPWKLIANLPYNVAAPVVLRALDEAPNINEIVVMVQREVAERLAAPAGSSSYGIPSVKVAYWGRAEILGTVSRNVFFPVPRVESALVKILRAEQPATPADPDRLFALVRQAFGQRRKMLRRSLANVVDEAVFTMAEVAPTARPQELDVSDWGRLVLALDTGD